MNKRQKLVQEQFLNDEERVIKRLKTVYNQSYKDITDKIKTLDSSIASLQKALADVGEDEIGNLAAAYLKNMPHLTPDEAKETLQSMIQSKVYQKNFQQALGKQVDDVLGKMLDKEFTTVSDYLNECYENGFMGTMYDLQGQGIPLCFPLDQEAMVRAVRLDSKISKGLYSRLGEDVDLLKRKITAQVSRGISTGMSYKQVAQQLAGASNIGFNNAVRIARTEGHRIQAQSAMDACYKATEKGADIVKQWDAALDARTRESHAQVDGEIRELDKKFSNGLMFPGDPSGGAAEVVNCRCALLQRARWALDEEELEELKRRAEYFGLDKSEQFEDFKKNYLKASDDGINESVYGLKAPVRPKRSDFDDEDAYLAARNKYREDREKYQARIDDAVQNNLARKRQYATPDDIKEWAKRHNIEIADEVFDKVDIRAFDDYIKVADQLLEKYPGVLDSIENVGGKYRIGIGSTGDELANALGGFQFGDAFENYEGVLHQYFDSISMGDLVQGNGTIQGLYKHEFGHNLQFAMKQNLPSASKRVEFDRDVVKSLMNADGVSEYAKTNVDELFAEAFAAYESGAKSELAEEFGKLLDRWKTPTSTKINNVLTNAGKDDIMKSLTIGRSIGAKAKNYPVKLLDSRQHVRLSEGQTITGRVFAGKGTGTEIRERFRLEADYKIPANKWEKVSGEGIILVDGKQVKAELHWYEADGEVFEMKVKRYL
jgi:hypothetical protein